MDKAKKLKNKSNDSGHSKMPGYTKYPPEEDIYNKYKKVPNKELEVWSNRQSKKDKNIEANKDRSGGDFSNQELDIPGAELDDDSEIIGNEDEENNYYSLGGDNHSNLDENNTD